MRDFSFALSSRTLLPLARISKLCFLEVCDVCETSACRYRRRCDVSHFRSPCQSHWWSLTRAFRVDVAVEAAEVDRHDGARKSGAGRQGDAKCNRAVAESPYHTLSSRMLDWVLDATSAPTCCWRRVLRVSEFPFSHQNLFFLRNSKFLLANANEEGDVSSPCENHLLARLPAGTCAPPRFEVRNSSGRVARARFLAPRELRFGYMRVGMRMLRRGRSHHLIHPFFGIFPNRISLFLSLAKSLSRTVSPRSAHPSCSRHFLFLLMPVREETPRWRVTVGAQPHCERTCYVHASSRRSHLRRWLMEGVHVGG